LFQAPNVGEIRKSVALELDTEYWLIDIVNLENFFVYDPETTCDVLHDPFHVMVWAENRLVSGQPTTTKPDIVWEYETDPRLELSCGHAISKWLLFFISHAVHPSAIKLYHAVFTCILINNNYLYNYQYSVLSNRGLI
jgi:hypothetical protein